MGTKLRQFEGIEIAAVFKMHKTISLLITAILNLTALWPMQSLAEYKSGRVLYESLKISEEAGRFIQVPIDYERPELGTTSIYYHFASPFDPTKPTIIIFDGGPGGSSHNGTDPELEAIGNVLRFDSRGVAFSRPADENLYRDPEFYSFLNTARDARAITNAHKITNLVAVGFSAGAVPAFEFARLEPRRVRSVILHSPSNPGSGLTSKMNFLLGFVEQVVTKYPNLWPFLDAVATSSAEGSEWLSIFIYERIKRYGIELGLAVSAKELSEMAERWRNGTPIKAVLESDSLKPNLIETENIFGDELFFDRYVQTVLLKKELAYSSFEIHWRNGAIQIVPESKRDLGASEEPFVESIKVSPNNVYSRRGAVIPAVYVVSGTDDMQTTNNSARDIYSQIPSNKKTLVTISGAGHCEMGFELCEGKWQTHLKHKMMENLWRAMVAGKPISPMTTLAFNSIGDLKIKVTSDHTILKSCWEILSRATPRMK